MRPPVRTQVLRDRNWLRSLRDTLRNDRSDGRASLPSVTNFAWVPVQAWRECQREC